METALQVATLQELGVRIKAGLATFIDVGLCLLEIRDRRLYKDKGYTRFEDYCREQWGFSRVRAHQFIEGAEVSSLLTIVNTEPPATESQARELAPLVKADEQAALSIGGDGARLKLDVPETDLAQVLKLVLLKNTAFRVTIDADET